MQAGQTGKPSDPSEAIVFKEPVDLAYTWVNDKDPDWQNKRQKYAKQYADYIKNNDSNSNTRFRNRDELKYALRSAYLYAPFVRHIFIVTCGQTPEWLAPHEKITIINHEEIFLQPENLPTFNSVAIESNLHRIQGLSEYFIYSNDDMFFGHPNVPTNYFTHYGKLKFAMSISPAPDDKVTCNDSAYRNGWKNVNILLNKHFKKESRLQLMHAPYALRKSFLSDLEQEFPEVFRTCSQNHFRMHTDYVLINGLIQYWALYKNMAIRTPRKTFSVWMQQDYELNVQQLNMLMHARPQSFCIEDCCDIDNQEMDLLTQEFLMSYFPDPAPWEIT